MNNTPQLSIFYRISDGSYPKLRFERATKERCLKNFLRHCFDPDLDNLWLYADNVRDETFKDIEQWIGGIPNVTLTRTHAGSSAASFRLVLEHALRLADDSLVWFQEDDYWYLPNARTVLLEGLERADYASLYDHADRYIPAKLGGNPNVSDDGSEMTRVFLTKSSHWRLAGSTTMTFATDVKTLRADAKIWHHYAQGTHPRDLAAFTKLGRKGRWLATPIPALGTHCMPEWSAPLINWENEFHRQ